MPADPSPQVHIVGIGPGGDARYLTTAARRVIAQADVVIYPGTQIGDGIRGLVRGELRTGRWFEDTEIHAWIRTAVARQKQVAWLCSGDPTLYAGEPERFGSLSVNIAWLRTEGLSFEVHPGVSSLQALLARRGLENARPDCGRPMAAYAPGRDSVEDARRRLDGLAALQIPLALFLADQRVTDIVEIGTRHFGLGGRAILGHRVSWPDEWILDTTLAELGRLARDGGVPKHTLLLIGPWHG